MQESSVENIAKLENEVLELKQNLENTASLKELLESQFAKLTADHQQTEISLKDQKQKHSKDSK